MTEWTETNWTVIGYVGPQTKNDGTRLVHLYPDLPEGAKYHCATVYADQDIFAELPTEIQDQVLNGDPLPGRAPDMEMAIKDGWLKRCTPFDIITPITPDGKKKKSPVLRVLAAGEAGGSYVGQGFIGSTPASGNAGGERAFNALSSEEVEELFGTVAIESLAKLEVLERLFGVEDDDREEWNTHLFDLAWYDANKNYFRYLRDLTKPIEASPQAVTNVTSEDILQGDQANFLGDVAKHPLIENDQEAKGMFQELGISKSAPTPEARLVQARRVWLYATLLREPFNLDAKSAAQAAHLAYQDDDIPF